MDKNRVTRLHAGDSYVEDISAQTLAAALATGRYRPSLDYADAADFDVAVSPVPTPLREGNPDLSGVLAGRAGLLRRHRRPSCGQVATILTGPTPPTWGQLERS